MVRVWLCTRMCVHPGGFPIRVVLKLSRLDSPAERLALPV